MTELKKNILVVDDELSFCRLMERMLLDNDYACSFVTSGAEALQKLSSDTYDLVMTDIGMPEIDGLQLIEKLRDQYPELAILVTTGLYEREIARKALEMGAYGYMLKPCDDFEVMVHVVNAFRRAELERISQTYQHKLEAQVAERTAELETANQALEETNKMLRQQEKLASIGQLAAGIAHEMKTPTGFVNSNLGSLEKYQQRLIQYITALEKVLAESASADQKSELKSLGRELKIDWILDDTVDLVRNCLEGTDRLQSIIKGLKDFSHQDQEKEEVFDLNQVLEESLLLVRNELKYKAEVRLQMNEVPQLSGYRQRLSQVFINLLVNASHAIEDRGVVKISTQAEKGEIVVRVTDDGCGIAEENLAKIFEPFYTSKEIGVGTGLGLSIVKDIIEQHQGEIKVESTVGEGTVFTIRLPAVNF